MSVLRFAPASAACAALSLAVPGCHAWRPASEPLPALTASGGMTLRVTTRPMPTGEAYRYVLRSARLEGDSLVGVPVNVARRVGRAGWNVTHSAAGRPRVALATADIVEVSRQEPSSGRTLTLLVVVAALVAAAGYGLTTVPWTS